MYLIIQRNQFLMWGSSMELWSLVSRVMDTNPSSSSSCSGGSCVLARCEDNRCGVWRLPPPAAVPDGVQHRQRHLVHRPGPPVRHHHLQDIQRHHAGHTEI